MLVACCACTAPSKPCLVPRDCGEGFECLANSCRVMGVDPVDAQSKRVVLDPTQLTVIGGQSDGATVLLGGNNRHAHVLLGFDVRPLAELGAQRLERAHLLIENVDLPPASTERASIEVTRLIDPWNAETLQTGLEPRRALTSTQGLLQPGNAGRIDVTEALRAWLRAPHASHGFCVGSDGEGQILLSAGPHGAFARLEAYFRPHQGGHD